MPETSTRSNRRLALLLAAMAAIGPFSIDTYLPAFHDIATQLQASPLAVQQTLSSYLFAFAAMTLWHGAIADCYGRRRVILVALAACWPATSPTCGSGERCKG